MEKNILPEDEIANLANQRGVSDEEKVRLRELSKTAHDAYLNCLEEELKWLEEFHRSRAASQVVWALDHIENLVVCADKNCASDKLRKLATSFIYKDIARQHADKDTPNSEVTQKYATIAKEMVEKGWCSESVKDTEALGEAFFKHLVHNTNGTTDDAISQFFLKHKACLSKDQATSYIHDYIGKCGEQLSHPAVPFLISQGAEISDCYATSLLSRYIKENYKEIARMTPEERAADPVLKTLQGFGGDFSKVMGDLDFEREKVLSSVTRNNRKLEEEFNKIVDQHLENKEKIEEMWENLDKIETVVTELARYGQKKS